MNNPYYNSEGYADPTAYAGTNNIIREESETERRACRDILRLWW